MRDHNVSSVPCLSLFAPTHVHLDATLVRSRQRHCDHAQHHDTPRRLRRRLLECILRPLNATAYEGHAQDEEDVGENGSNERLLDDAQLTLDQGYDSYDELHGVAEGGIEEAAERGAKLESGLLGRVAEELYARVRRRSVSAPQPRHITKHLFSRSPSPTA